MTTLATYLNRGNADPVYLVEFNARKLADGSVEPLYFSKPAAYFPDKQFLPVISALPDIDRAANDTMDPAYLPTYGDLTLLISGAYKPDAGNSIAWNLLLYKDTYTLTGQDITIKIGQPGDAYAAFTTIFTGQIGEVNWTDAELTLMVYDKAQEFETSYPDYELPESSDVDEDNWDQPVPIILGEVKNYSPVPIKEGALGSIVIPGVGTFDCRHALACHVIEGICVHPKNPAKEAVYFNQADDFPLDTPSNYYVVLKDISPVRKDTILGGTVLIQSFGPYTGTLTKAKWIIQIDSITAGTEVGLATFRWRLETDVDEFGSPAWQGEGLLTWKLAYDPTTFIKLPSIGTATMTVSGTYTGVTKDTYKVKISRLGDIGDIIPPQFIWSDDGGLTQNPDDVCTWTPAAAAPGVMSVVAHNPGDTVLVEITTGGNVGGAVRFKWSQDGGATWDTDNQIPSTAPIELFAGYSIQFTAPGIGGTDDYDAGDAGGSTSAIDILDNNPITLNRGLSVAFPTVAGVWAPDQTWTPVASALGTMVSLAINPADSVAVEITTTGSAGLGAMFKWDAGAGWSAPQVVESSLSVFDGGAGYVVGDVLGVMQGILTDKTVTVEAVDGSGAVTAVRPKDIGSPGYTVANELTTISGSGTGCKINLRSLGPYPITLFAGHTIGFTELGVTGVDDFEAGDAGTSFAAYLSSFVENDLWTFTFKEIPIPLADGVSIQFITQPGQDFYLWDEFSFILMSTIYTNLGSASLTVDLQGLKHPSTGVYAANIADIIRALIETFLGWEAADFDTAAFDVFKIAIPYKVGLAIESPESITAILEKLLTGIPAIYSITIAGQMYIQELMTPSGSPVATFIDEQIMVLPAFKQLPDITKRVYLEYDKNYTTDSSQDTVNVSQARKGWLKRGNRQISRKDDSVLDNYPLASDIGPLETAIISREDAGLLADKDLALYQVPRETMALESGLQAVQREIGDIVEVLRDTFEQGSGQLYMVQGIHINFTDRLSELTLWR